MISEKQLIKDCQQGIKSSQYELVKRYSGMLISVCQRYVIDHHSAKDVLQESYIKIFTHIGNYKHTGSFEGWMRRIAVRCALNWIEKNSRKRESELDKHHQHDSVDPKVFHYIGLEAVQKIVNELPLGFRTVFNLNVTEGYSHKEISDLLGITESTSRSQLTRAKKLLQKKLESVDLQKYRTV